MAGTITLPEIATPATPASARATIFVGAGVVNNGVAGCVDDAGTLYQMVKYAEGTWTPTWTGLTVVGSPTYSGEYTRIGRLVFATVIITAGGANTTASAVGGTYINNLPFSAGQYGMINSVNLSTGADYGGYYVFSSSAYTNSWAATNGTIVTSMIYRI